MQEPGGKKAVRFSVASNYYADNDLQKNFNDLSNNKNPNSIIGE